MVLIEKDRDLDKAYLNNCLKFIAIGDDICAVELKMLQRFKAFVERRMLNLTQDYIDCLPVATRSIDHITMKTLQVMPVLMLESPVHDGKYVRWDGRHRILGAWKKGIISVPALWYPREVWSKFIVGYRVYGQDRFVDTFDGVVETDALPYLWDRSPIIKSGVDRHLEMNFDLPFQWSK